MPITPGGQRVKRLQGRCDVLIDSPLDPGSDSGLSPGWIIALYSWARHFTPTVPLSTQEYKWVPASCQGNLTKLRGYL